MILSFEIFSYVQYIITSCPSTVASLPYKHVCLRIEILGFTEAQVEYVCSYILCIQ